MKIDTLADKIRKPDNQIAITQRLSDYAKRLSGEIPADPQSQKQDVPREPQ